MPSSSPFAQERCQNCGLDCQTVYVYGFVHRVSAIPTRPEPVQGGNPKGRG